MLAQSVSGQPKDVCVWAASPDTCCFGKMGRQGEKKKRLDLSTFVLPAKKTSCR